MIEEIAATQFLPFPIGLARIHLKDNDIPSHLIHILPFIMFSSLIHKTSTSVSLSFHFSYVARSSYKAPRPAGLTTAGREMHPQDPMSLLLTPRVSDYFPIRSVIYFARSTAPLPALQREIKECPRIQIHSGFTSRLYLARTERRPQSPWRLRTKLCDC